MRIIRTRLLVVFGLLGSSAISASEFALDSSDYLDDQLGLNWIGDDDISSDPLSRHKRATGTTYDDFMFSLSTVASQTVNLTQFNYGHSLTLAAEIDIPAINVTNRGEILIEAFVLDADNNLTSFHICQAHMVSRGANVVSFQEYPYYEDFNKVGYPSVIEKTTMLLEDVHTDGLEATNDDNKIKVQFQAIMVNTDGLVFGVSYDYWVTIGVRYGSTGNYVWIGQEPITAVPSAEIYPASVGLVSPPTAIAKGDSVLFQVAAYITEPFGDLNFTLVQPLGFNDLFHFGEINYEVGNAFACNNPDLWVGDYQLSPSGLSVNRRSVSLSGLINREGRDETDKGSSSLRNASDPVNLITFFVPIHVMNLENVPTGVERSISFGISIGDSKIWTAEHNVIINPYVAPASLGTITVNETIGYNNLTGNNGIVRGDAAVFRVKLNVPSGWINLDTVVNGDSANGISPVGVRVISSGFIGYIPYPWAVTERVGDQLTAYFGEVKNLDTDTTVVELEIAFAVSLDATLGPVSLSAKVGSADVGPLDFDVVDNVALEDVIVVPVDYSLNATLRPTGQGAIQMEVTVPHAAGGLPFIIEATPDVSVMDYSLRICEIRVRKIGNNLPCTHHLSKTSQTTFAKTNETRPFYDYGELTLDNICPAFSLNSQLEDHSFRVQIFYELPNQLGISTVPTLIGAGLKLGNTSIWVASSPYDVLIDDYTGLPIESGILGPTTPFISVYPDIMIKDRINKNLGSTYKKNEGFVVRFIIKLPPMTRGDYVLTIPDTPGFRVCKLEMAFVGDNLPCTEPPGPSLNGYENTAIVYAQGDDTLARTCGKGAEYRFKGLTNWGQDPMIEDLIPDADSIQIIAFMQACPDAPVGNATIGYTLTPGGDPVIEGSAMVEVDAVELIPTGDPLVNLTYRSLIGPDDVIFTTAPKLMQFAIELPAGFFGEVQLTLTNLDYASDVMVEFCTLKIVETGPNLPCIYANKDMTVSLGSSKLTADGIIYESISGVIDTTCAIDYSVEEDANTIYVEAAVRVRDDIAVSQVNLQLEAVPAGNTANTFTLAIGPLTVMNPIEGDILTHNVTTDEVDVQLDQNYMYGLNKSSGDEFWVPFFISFPPEKTLNMEASLLLPSDGGKARVHAMDAKFGSSAGVNPNVLCSSMSTDLRRYYSTMFAQSANLTTFMQMDSVTINLGYMVNAGHSLKQAVHQPDDDAFVIRVRLQLSDHVLNTQGASFDVHFSVRFGEVIVVASQTINVVRPPNNGLASRSEETGKVRIAINEPATLMPYIRNEIIEVTSVIKHEINSRAEGYPTRIRVFTPKYLTRTPSDVFSTNYTLPNGELVTVEPADPANITNYFDFVFPQGITYADIVELNFTLTVDPYNLRLPGSGNETTSIVMTTVCEQNVIDAYPATIGTQTSCGSYHPVDVVTFAPECYETLTSVDIVDECQIQASSVLNPTTKPILAISEQFAWSPALRTGPGWNEYLQFDFLAITRVNRLTVGHDSIISGISYRTADKVLIQYSNVPSHFMDLMEADLTLNNVIEFLEPVEARFFRIVILQASQFNQETTPIGVNKVKFEGCFPKNYVRDTTLCLPDQTLDTSNATLYRHFAVDDALNIVYFCDRSPFMSGMFCYSSNRADPTANTWTELPRYISYIVGYSPSFGRMYFKDSSGRAVFSSIDGIRIELTDPTTLPGDIIPAVSVPAITSTDLGTKLWAGTRTEYKATFNGILSNTELLVQWKSCCV